MKKLILVLLIFVCIGSYAQNDTIQVDSIIYETGFIPLDTIDYKPDELAQWFYTDWNTFPDADSIIYHQERINRQGIREYREMKVFSYIEIKKTYDFDSFINEKVTELGFLNWKSKEFVKVGDVRTYNGSNYECIQAHVTQSDWMPDITPALWKTYSGGAVSDFVQPTGAHDAYDTGDRVLFEGSIYESLIDANVWSPTGYPAGWKIIE